ncbi:MAG: putative alpha/beta hydrolase, partial [Arcticibacterium sp.]
SSPHEGLKGCKYEITDWAKQDMNVVLKFLKNKFNDIPLYFLYHSVGGQLIGMVPEINEINGILAIATSSGYAKNMTFSGWFQSFYFFRIVRPCIHLFYGYSKFKFLGIMEDLSIRVTNRWHEWCRRKTSFFDAKNAKKIENLDRFKTLKMPVKVAIATDDSICSIINTEIFWKNVYSHGGIHINWLKPEYFNLKAIGHFDFSRKTSKDKLWPWALTRLEQFNKAKHPLKNE